MIRAGLIAMALIALKGTPSDAAECRNITFDGSSYTVCEVDLERDDLRLFLNDDAGAPYGFFGSLDEALKAQGLRLGFAMNAGMYHEDRSPVGHYIEEGVEARGVIDSAGPGNFGLLPNGVFCLRDGRADVIETKRYLRNRPACRFATQSGPMLVSDGRIHPQITQDGPSRLIRNAVGVDDEGRAHFVISNAPISFGKLARFYKDELEVKNALFLDDTVSLLWNPVTERLDTGAPIGPIVVVSKKASE